MARITIEDCMEHVPNRFHLVRMASIRAKQLKKGALPLLTADGNKYVVMSLREIAAGLVKPGELPSSSPQGATETDLGSPPVSVDAENEATAEIAVAVESDPTNPTKES